MPRAKAASLAQIDQQTAEFLDRALQRRLNLAQVIKTPQKAAEQLGMRISANTVKRLKALGALAERRRMDATDREVLAFFNKVVVDGRFINEFAASPERVAMKLEVRLSRAAVQRLKEYRLSNMVSIGAAGGAVMSPAAVAIVVAAIIVLWSRDAKKLVIDKSGVVKL